MNAFVTTDDTPCRIDYLTVTRQTLSCVFVFEITIDEARVIAVRHKTNLLRLFLFGNANQVMLSSSFTSFGLRHLAKRKECARQLRLCQLPQKIRLIFLLVFAAQQFVTIANGIEFDARVMAGRDFLTAETDGQSIE